MAWLNNDRIDELLLMANDRLTALNKRWWQALVLAVILSVPLFFIFKYSFSALFIRNYQPPTVMTERPLPQPLTVIDRLVFDLGDSNYAGLVRIKNINLERGVPELAYSVKFKTIGGTVLTEIAGKTFVLPASEKILAFPKFTSEKKPELIEFSFIEPKFLYKPQIPAVSLEAQRILIERTSSGFYVNAGVKNLSPFTISQVYLPVLLYDNASKIVGVNSTVINSVRSSEIRTFRFVWSKDVPEAVRAEINPEINIFDKGIFSAEAGKVELFSGQNSENLGN